MAPAPPTPDARDRFATARAELVELVSDDLCHHGIGNGTTLDPRVAAALRRVPRERFVPAHLAGHAYDNRPLPIGHGQTISQPLIVAVMTHLLQLTPSSKVLEVGTGSGYQAAILAELAGEVVTIEIVEPLAASARAILGELGYQNVDCRIGDGAEGCAEKAPYDGVIVTAAGPSIPPALIDQLVPGGRLVTPVGGHPFDQDLVLITKDAAGHSHERRLFPVAFVPLTGHRDQP